MKSIICLILMFIFIPLAFADRICLEKSTGKLIEYQSGDAPLGTLTQNAINAGFDPVDIEEKYVTKSEWAQIRYDQIEKPAKDKAKIKKQKIKDLKDKLELQLNLTREEIDLILDK